MNPRMQLAMAGSAALLLAFPASAAAPGAIATGAIPTKAEQKFDHELLTVAQAKARYRGRLSQIVLEFLSRMETAVNKDKATVSAADWQPLGELLDRDKFHRVGNFAEHMGWPGYSQLLVAWAKGSWWQGRIWRMSEVPGRNGEPGLVYLEAEERSSGSGPVTEAGGYSRLESISVYEIDRNNKIVGLHVYDHKPRAATAAGGSGVR